MPKSTLRRIIDELPGVGGTTTTGRAPGSASSSLLRAANVVFTAYRTIVAANVQRAIELLEDQKLNLSGGSMSGELYLAADPIDDDEAATKRYVDTYMAEPNEGTTALRVDTLAGVPMFHVVHETESGRIGVPTAPGIDWDEYGVRIAEEIIHLFDNVGIGVTAINTNVRLLIDALVDTVAAVDIRGGGQTGRGFASDPADAQGLVYLTHKIDTPPAGLLGMVKGYMAYTGNLSASTATLEAFEIVNRIQGATAAPSGYLLGAEIVAGLNNGGGNMSALTFPNVTGILADVNAETTNCGTITWARSLQTNFPSAATTGNALTNAAGAYIGSGQAVTPSVTPTNAYGVYIQKPDAGTNVWAAYIQGNVEIADATYGSLQLNPTAASEFTLLARNNADTGNATLYVIGTALYLQTGAAAAATRVVITDTLTDITTRLRQGAPNTEPDAGIINAGQISFWLDESAHKLMVKAKYANGTTVKSGEVGLFDGVQSDSATGTYTITDKPIVYCNGTFTVNLPAVATSAGRVCHVINTGTGVITIDGNASETINGQTTMTLTTQYDSAALHCNGTEWYLI